MKRAINATRFIATTRSAAAAGELTQEMERVLLWDAFNINRVAQLSERQPLLLVGLTALNHFGLLQTFSIEQETAVNFLRAVEHHYLCAPAPPVATTSLAARARALRAGRQRAPHAHGQRGCAAQPRAKGACACRPNAYHNSTHAADVTQALLAILYTDGLHTKLTDLELLACFLAAILHDVAHPGLSNPFLTKTQDEQARCERDGAPCDGRCVTALRDERCVTALRDEQARCAGANVQRPER